MLLQACGGGPAVVETAGSDAPTTPTTPPPTTPANHAPVISGTPATALQAGQNYSFTPSATDSDGDTLTFSITNKPSWATFEASTGKLTGQAPAAGSFAGVTISVSDGKASAALAPFAITVSSTPVVTGSATLSWLPPTTRDDGSALQNLAGFNIRYGTSAGAYTEQISVSTPGVTSYQVDNLQAGTYYFVITAVDSAGIESNYSASVSKTIS